MALSFRANLFWAAREIFRYPEQPVLEENLDDLQDLLDWHAARSGQPKADNGVLRIPDPEELQQLQIDFTALFINSVPVAKAHPFAGWYEGESVVFGRSDQQMRRFYADYGIECDDSQRMPADHIAVELDFLAIMTEKYEQTGEGVYLNALREMVNQHLAPWVFQFLQDIQNNARTEYFKHLALVLTCLIREAAVELREVA